MYAKKVETHVVDTWFQVVLVLITSLAVVAILYFNLQRYKAFEPEIISKDASRTTQSNTMDLSRIETGIFVRDIAELNINAGTLTANLLVWFYFDPQQVYPDAVGKFVFERAEEKFRSEPIVDINTQHEYFVKYNVRLKCAMPFNYQEFPVDDHRIDFIMTNYDLDASKVTFTTNNKLITLNPEIHLEGWHIVNAIANDGYLKSSLNPENEQHAMYNPRAVFGFELERSGVRQILSTILPLLVIFFTALFTFTIDPEGTDFYNVVALSIASIMGLIAYRFVIETVSPQTGYFTIADHIFLFFLIATSVILFVNALGERVTSRIKSGVTLLLHIATIVMFFVVFKPWL